MARVSYDHSEALDAFPNPDVHNGLTSKLNLLSQTIERLNEQICKRKKLSRRFKLQLRDELLSFENTLNEVNTMWRMGDNLAMEQRRSQLEGRISDIKKELREDNLSRWKDIVWLEKELQEVVKEYYSLLQSVRALGREA